MPIGSDANFPLNTDPSIVPAQPAVSRVNLGSPLPPANPFRAPMRPTGPGLQPQPQGQMTVWDALRNLFSGWGGAPSPQGMRGLIAPRGQGAPGTDALGNPTTRFG